MPTDHQQASVIVVDDDDALSQSLKFCFELEGFEVRTFPNAESVLAHAALPDCGCMIIDMKLPGQNGMELVRALRARSVTLPVILITTNPNTALRKRAANNGIAIVEKPLLSDALIAKVQALMSGSGAIQAKGHANQVR